jgi:hypothetical protein
LSLPALRLDRDLAATCVRFTTLRSDGVWTVWDADRELAVVHEAVWDESAARDVAESLNHHPGYAHLWTWSANLAEVG